MMKARGPGAERERAWPARALAPRRTATEKRSTMEGLDLVMETMHVATMTLAIMVTPRRPSEDLRTCP